MYNSSLAIVAGSSLNASSVSDPAAITIHVKDAYYFDADGDGYQDDTFASVELFLSGKNRITFDYWLTLGLPSGFEFIFGLTISTKYSYLELNHTMINTALEAGWYSLHIEVIQRTGGMYYCDAQHVFDPPGGSSGSLGGSAPGFSTTSTGY